MLFNLSIPWAPLRVGVLASYLIGMVLGSGLHVHATLSHEHDNEGLHGHSPVAHVHATTLIPSAASHSEIISPSEDEHRHPVPLVQLIAIRALHPKSSKSVQQNTVYSFDVPSAPFLIVPRILLVVFSPDTLPPLHSLTVHSHLGRSPPAGCPAEAGSVGVSPPTT